MAVEGTTLEEMVSKWTIKADLTPLEEGRRALEGLTLSFAAMGATVAGAAASLFGIASTTAEAGDQAAKAAVKYGLLAQEYQGLKYAARGEGEFLDMGLLFLNKAMDEANKGAKEAKESFGGLGVAISAGGKLRSANDVLLDIAEKFKSMPNDARRTKAAVELFGRSGANLIPFLTRGRDEIIAATKEAEEFGYVIKDTAAAEEFKDSFEDLENILRGFRNMVGVEIIPLVIDLAHEFKEFLRTNREVIVSGLNDFVREMVVQTKAAVGFLWNMYRAASALARIFGGFGTIIRTVTRAMLALTALAAVHYLGSVAIAARALGVELVALAAKYTAAGWAALFAQLKMLAGPALVGAAIVLLLLALEDLYTFFSGNGESITGDMLKAFKGGIDWLVGAFQRMGDWVMSYLGTWAEAVRNRIMSVFQPIVDVLTWIGDKSKSLTGDALVNGVKSLGRGIGRLFGGGAAVTAAAAGVAGATPNMGNLMGLTPSLTSIGGDSSKSMMSKPVINQTIQIGEGASALETGKAVGSATENALAQQHREAARTFSAQGDY